MASHITVGVAQVHTLSTIAETLAALARTAKRGADLGADLLLFPEAYLGGYPRGTNFGCSIGARTDVGREQFRRYFLDAVDLGDTPKGAGNDWVHRRIGEELGNVVNDGEEATERLRGDGTREHLERVAQETGVFIVTGVVERAGGSLYCSVLYIDPIKGCIGKRRKVMPTGTERLIWGQGSPATLRAVRTTIKGVDITLAAAICWENYMPLLRASLYAQNVNIYLAPTADGRDTWLPLLRTIALEGRTFVLSSNQCIRESDLPEWVRPTENDPSGASEPGARHWSSSERRDSPMTTKIDHNHEINWPSPDSKSSGALGRRSSITISEGTHEVCLPALSPQRSIQVGQSRLSATLEQETEPVSKQELKETDSNFATHGGSCIVGPDGAVIAGPIWDDTDGIVVARIDLHECIRGRLDFDCAGSYSRNDSFELKVRGLDLNPPG